MDVFNYIAVAFSIIIGLGLSYLLDGISKVIQHNQRIQLYWIHSLWVIIVILLHLQFWFAFWEYHKLEVWSYSTFITTLLAPMALFIVADLLFPDITVETETKLNLKSHFFSNKIWIFSVLAIYSLLVILYANILREGGNWLQPSNAWRCIGFVLCLVAAWSKSEKAHAIIAILSFLFCGIFFLLFNSTPLSE
jgi:hypothetical protein